CLAHSTATCEDQDADEGDCGYAEEDGGRPPAGPVIGTARIILLVWGHRGDLPWPRHFFQRDPSRKPIAATPASVINGCSLRDFSTSGLACRAASCAFSPYSRACSSTLPPLSWAFSAAFLVWSVWSSGESASCRVMVFPLVLKGRTHRVEVGSTHDRDRGGGRPTDQGLRRCVERPMGRAF